MRCPASALPAAAAGVALATLTLLLAVPATAATAAEPAPVTYRPPVDAPVVDTFRPPRSPYGPGNRGVDYATAPGTPVRAAAPGVVAFAGSVAGGLHVVVLHADGIRTGYSFLRGVGVRRGQRLGPGEALGTAGPSLHFGARAGEAYLDPLVLLAPASGGGRRVHLVPEAERELHSEERERRGLLGALAWASGAAARVGGGAVEWARQAPAAAVSVAGAAIGFGLEEALVGLDALSPMLVEPWELALVGKTWWDRRETCTPEDVAPPPPAGRRIAVLVAGLGSSSENAAIYQVQTDTLGYAPADVYRFSYLGESTAENRYGPPDTQVDIAESGRKLRALVERIHAQNPGVPIDILAHSQGGIVTRSALGQRAPPGVENVVTLGSPHEGADLATAAETSARSPMWAGFQWLVGRSGVTGIDPTSTSVGQLSETSGFMRDLNSRPLPDGLRVTSIAGRADFVVPSPRSRLRGANYAVIDVPSIDHHNALPGSDAATREIALARAGMEPTCEGLADALVDFLSGRLIATTEDAVGIGLLAVGGR